MHFSGCIKKNQLGFASHFRDEDRCPQKKKQVKRLLYNLQSLSHELDIPRPFYTFDKASLY